MGDATTKPPEEPFCRWVFGDRFRAEFVALTSDGRAAVMSAGGERLSLVLGPPPDYKRIRASFDRVAMLPRDEVVAMGRYRGNLKAIRWRTAELLWKADDLRNLNAVECCDGRRLIAHQFTTTTGKCTEIDALTGERLGNLRHVSDVGADSLTPRMLTLLKRSFSELDGLLELRTSLRGDPVVARPIELSDLREPCFGEDWIACTENLTGSVWCLSDGLETRWRYTPEPGYYFLTLCALSGKESIFGLRRSSTAATDPLGMVFDARTGRILDQRVIPMRHVSVAPVSDGAMIVSPMGVIRLPEMDFEPRELRVE